MKSTDTHVLPMGFDGADRFDATEFTGITTPNPGTSARVGFDGHGRIYVVVVNHPVIEGWPLGRVAFDHESATLRFEREDPD